MRPDDLADEALVDLEIECHHGSAPSAVLNHAPIFANDGPVRSGARLGLRGCGWRSMSLIASASEAGLTPFAYVRRVSLRADPRGFRPTLAPAGVGCETIVRPFQARTPPRPSHAGAWPPRRAS